MLQTRTVLAVVLAGMAPHCTITASAADKPATGAAAARAAAPPAPLSPGDLREVVALSSPAAPGSCSAVYIGTDAVLTTATCACRLKLDTKPTDGRLDVAVTAGAAGTWSSMPLSTRSLRLPPGRSCRTAAGADAQQAPDLALVRFERRPEAPLLDARATAAASDAAIAGRSEIEPAAIAAPSLYLLDVVTSLSVVMPAVRGGQPDMRRLGSAAIEHRVCGDAQKQCSVGSEAVVARAGGGQDCRLQEGAPAFVWLSPPTDPQYPPMVARPAYALAGLVSRPFAASDCRQVVSLISPAVVHWIVRSNGIPVILCRAPGDCSLMDGG